MHELKPAKTIAVQDWMQAKETAAVMQALGGAAQALFVGGCVRNMLLGVAVDDIDIATVWPPQESTRKLEEAGIKVVPTGIDHGTVTAITGGKAFEVTTLRRDVQTDGRRAVVDFTADWRADAQRRDFTINTLLADPAGNIYDPTGQGLADLEARRVRFVGDPAQRIAEDYLRILRFFRFHAFYGQGAPDPAALASCAAAAAHMNDLSKERITKEFLRLLSADRPEAVISLMFDQGILRALRFPEYDPALLTHLCEFQHRYGLGFTASRLLALAGLRTENVDKILKFLLIPKVFVKDIHAISEVLKLDDLGNDHAVKVAVYKYGRVPSAQALMIELANDRVMNGDAPAALAIIQKWEVPTFPLTGEDLIRAGMKPGPELGRKLQEIEEWWIRTGFQADAASCRGRVAG
jgi:poly(A) polymerase